jgi:hypothetical protein
MFYEGLYLYQKTGINTARTLYVVQSPLLSNKTWRCWHSTECKSLWLHADQKFEVPSEPALFICNPLSHIANLTLLIYLLIRKFKWRGVCKYSKVTILSRCSFFDRRAFWELAYIFLGLIFCNTILWSKCCSNVYFSSYANSVRLCCNLYFYNLGLIK